VELEYPDGDYDEVAAAACPKCGWKGICRELSGIPIPDAN